MAQKDKKEVWLKATAESVTILEEENKVQMTLFTKW